MNKITESEHCYGDHVHLLAHPFYHSILAKFCNSETTYPILPHYLRLSYEYLLQAAMMHSFPQKEVSIPTRMQAVTPLGVFHGKILDPDTSVVVVDIARAGIMPSQVCFELCTMLLNASGCRQDHIYINRKTNEQHQVIGTTMSGSKIGGDKENKILLFPDPMGATGGTLSSIVDFYQNKVAGKCKLMIALHLIVTPEYIRKVTQSCPGMQIFALRVDRAFSTPRALATIPGKYLAEEFGLNDVQYIVPGAGGIGEIMNNSFV